MHRPMQDENLISRRFNKLLPWLVFGSSALIYIVTTAPSIVTFFDDSLEFQLVGPTLGIAHPTGYPLYTQLLALWSRVLVPVGSWAWRVNLFSALCGAATVTALFLTARALKDWRAGITAALSFAPGPVWWSQTTLAEVYALHNLFVALILYVATTLSIRNGIYSPKRPDLVSSPYKTVYRRVTILCLLAGLSLAHHRTTLLLLPGLTLYLLWLQPDLWRPHRVWLLWLAALLLPLLLYLYIPLRAANGVIDLNQSYENSWSGFWHHVLARGYSGFLQENDLGAERSIVAWWTLFRQQFGLLGIVLGLIGGLGLIGPRQKAWFLILIIFLSNLIFAWFYRVPDVEVFLIPAFLCCALFVGGGVGWLTARAGALLPTESRFHSATSILLTVLLISGVAIGAGGRGAPVNRSQTWDAHDLAVAMAKVDFPPGSRVVGLEGEVTALRYMQRAEGLATNATGIVADDPDARQMMVHGLMEDGVPVYLTRELPGIETLYSFSGAGPLVRVWPRGEAQTPTPQQDLEIAFADGTLLLTGVDQAILQEAGGPSLRVAFYWQPQQPLTERYKLSLRIVEAAGELTRADVFPLHQAAYTDQWVPGEIVRDVHTIRLPHALAPETDNGKPYLQIILYAANSGGEAGRWELPLLP